MKIVPRKKYQGSRIKIQNYEYYFTWENYGYRMIGWEKSLPDYKVDCGIWSELNITEAIKLGYWRRIK